MLLFLSGFERLRRLRLIDSSLMPGLCNRSSCPLANSRYATIREDKGRCYLYIKTIERAHTPKNMWQKIRLKRQYAAALQQIDEHLAFWPKFLVHKNKQRLTKITQYLIRMRKLALKAKPKLITMPARKEKQLKRKEAKAETAAELERSIEKELLARLQSGTYGDIYNFPMRQYQKVLQQEETVNEGEAIDNDELNEYDEYVEGDEEEETTDEEGEDDDDEDEEEIEWLDEDAVGMSESDDEDIEDYREVGSSSDDDDQQSDEEEKDAGKLIKKRRSADVAIKAGKRVRRGRLEIEYEEEREDVRHPQN